MSLDFQPYLESIRTTYEKWWQLYTLTDAAGKQRQSKQASPTFDFGLMVQTVRPEERREEEKIERFPVLEGIRKYAEQHVLLVGRPGSGKSTALARLMLEEATTLQAKIPVLVELRYWQGSIEQLILDSLRRHGFAIESLDQVLNQSLILFDGVNELPSDEARSQLSAFRRNHPKLPMIFTTRDLSLDGDLGIEKKLEMQPLTEAQMQLFIRAYVPEQAEQMLRQLKDRLREFGQTPLLLWMLCGLFQQTGTIPENLGLVFREFTQGYERYLKDDVRIESDRAWWKPVLQQLAWVMMQGEKPTEFRVAIREEEAVRAISQFLDEKVPYAEDFARKCLRDLQKHHLIQVGANLEELEFRHQLIQEYYVAEVLLKKVGQLSDEVLKREYLNFIKWTEPVCLMLALVESEALVMQVLQLALAVDLQLGSRLLGEVKIDFAEASLRLINQLSLPKDLYIRLLGKNRSDKATDILKAALKDPDLSWAAINALGELSSQRALKILFQAVHHGAIENSNAHEAIFEIFGRVADQSSSNYLQQIVKYHNESFTRAFAARELRNFSSDDVLQTLYEAALDKHDYVSQKAISALWKIGSPKAIELIEAAENILYEDVNDYLKERVVEMKSFSERISSDLKQNIYLPPTAIERLQVYLKRHFNFALEADKPDFLLAVLERLLNTSNANHRLKAIQALGEISDQRAVSLLCKALTDSNFDNRAQAAIALAELADPSALPGLIDAFNHEENTPGSGSYVRQTIIEVLGDIGHPDALPFLKQLIDKSEPGLLDVILEAIARIGGEQSISFLYKLMHLGRIKHVSAWINRISEIQSDCRFYNYEIYQAHLKAQKHDRQTPQNSDRSSPTIYNIDQLGILNTGDTTIQGDQIGVESPTSNVDRASPNFPCD